MKAATDLVDYIERFHNPRWRVELLSQDLVSFRLLKTVRVSAVDPFRPETYSCLKKSIAIFLKSIPPS